MADTLLKLQVEGVAQVQANLNLAAKDVRAELDRVVWNAASKAVAQAKANLSGQVLGKTQASTGGTAGAVRAFPISGESFITANVGVGPEGYRGKFWERGFNGAQDVRSHLRAIKSGTRLQVMKLTRKGKFKGVKTYETGAVEVSAYSRNVDGSPRPWLSPAIDAVRDEFRSAVLSIADKKREV